MPPMQDTLNRIRINMKHNIRSTGMKDLISNMLILVGKFEWFTLLELVLSSTYCFSVCHPQQSFCFIEGTFPAKMVAMSLYI